MPTDSPVPVVVLGGVFLAVGLILLAVGAREEGRYRNTLVGRPDAREFLTGWPPRFWRRTLTMGGMAALAIGVVLLGIGLYLWLA
ncbi:MAG: hypothetical protein AB1603_08060 [Chloroflexota bacterium]